MRKEGREVAIGILVYVSVGREVINDSVKPSLERIVRARANRRK